MIINRIKQIIDYKDISERAFCREIGVANGFLTKVKDVGSDKLNKILYTYPEINAEWLITGEGNMLKKTKVYSARDEKDMFNEKIAQKIPLYDISSLKSLGKFLKGAEIKGYIQIPNIPKSDGAMHIIGDSMFPLLKSGDIILFKESNVNNIFYGEMYLLSIKINKNEEFITVKYLHKSEKGDEYITLTSENKEHSPNDILIENIKNIAIVKASIRTNTIV